MLVHWHPQRPEIAVRKNKVDVRICPKERSTAYCAALHAGNNEAKGQSKERDDV